MTTAVLILAAAFIAPLISDHLSRWIAIPSVVLELLLGILIGPVLLGWAHQGEVVDAISDLGLSMLMFLAGYEIDFARIKGRPLRLAVTGWLISLAAGLLIAFGIAAWLHGSSSDDLVSHDNAAALVLGLAISIFQSVTSIQEQTLTFVPKALGIVALLVILMPWMLRTLVEFATAVIQKMPQMTQ